MLTNRVGSEKAKMSSETSLNNVDETKALFQFLLREETYPNTNYTDIFSNLRP